MDDPHLFAGRTYQITELIQALHSDGACPIIYGDRGLGKTSLAVQAERMALGDTELLTSYSMLEWAFSEDSRFETLYFTCSDDTKDYSDLLQRLINLILGEDARMAPLGNSELVDRTRRVKFTVKLLEAEQLTKYAPQKGGEDARELSREEALLDLFRRVIEKSGHPLLVIIDELDRVPDTKGLASFIKANSSPTLKFVLVGIAQNISNLLVDHQSIERTGIPIQVPPMSERELIGIVRRAEDYLHDHGITEPMFTGEARRLLASLSAGFPWFVHVIGQEALLAAHGQGTRSVTQDDIIAAVHRLNGNRFAQKFADRYYQAVQGSEKREFVLRVLAQWPTPDVPLAELYTILREGLEVKNPGYYRHQLTEAQYGTVLMNHPFHKKGVARFCDEMFKVYIRLRPSISPGVDYLVADAWNRHRRFKRSSERGIVEDTVSLWLRRRDHSGARRGEAPRVSRLSTSPIRTPPPHDRG